MNFKIMKYIDLILLNLIAIAGTGRLTVLVCILTESIWGFVIMIIGLIFVNWVWWSIHFNNFHWF